METLSQLIYKNSWIKRHEMSKSSKFVPLFYSYSIKKIANFLHWLLNNIPYRWTFCPPKNALKLDKNESQNLGIWKFWTLSVQFISETIKVHICVQGRIQRLCWWRVGGLSYGAIFSIIDGTNCSPKAILACRSVNLVFISFSVQ